MKNWVTSDLHLCHFNIIRYCNRPFSSMDEMNDTLVRNWNSRIKEDDTVYHIGDFLFRNSSGGKPGEGIPTKASEWENKLNGKIIHVAGNHDRNNGVKTIIERIVIRYGRKRINMVHNPDHVDMNYSINLVGHIHNLWEIKRIKRGETFTDAINVGCDVWSFKPVTFEEIMKRYNKWLRENKYSRSK